MKNYKKDTRCCMCGYKFKNDFEKNNPAPYPKQLYLKNNSSDCCPKCNGIVLAMRISNEIYDLIKKYANSSKLNDNQKKQFCAVVFKTFGERFYYELNSVTPVKIKTA